MREAREETGLEVQLTRLVGIYFLPRWPAGDNHSVLFTAKPVGGMLQPQEAEVIEARYFALDALPEPLVWWHRQRIDDAMRGIGGGVVWTQRAVWPFGETVTRQAIYELMTQSGLSRQEFFLRYFSKPEPEPEGLEVLEVGWKQEE